MFPGGGGCGRDLVRSRLGGRVPCEGPGTPPRHKLLVSLGALGLVVLLWRIDLNAVQLALFHVGWGMALVLSQGIVARVLHASGWRFAFTREVAVRFSFGELVRRRVAADAIHFLTPTATIGREDDSQNRLG